MLDTTVPASVPTGAFIEHDLLPGVVMQVRNLKPCLTDGTRPLDHYQYLIVDPTGEDDWLCAYDVHPYEGSATRDDH